MKIFEPLITHSSPSCTADVRSAAVSEPASGSVMAPPLTASPRTVGSSHESRQAAFCSSVPPVTIDRAPVTPTQM